MTNYKVLRPLPVEFSIDLGYGFANVSGTLISADLSMQVQELATLEFIVSCASSENAGVRKDELFPRLAILQIADATWVRIGGTIAFGQEWSKKGFQVTVECHPLTLHTSYEDAARAEMQSLMEEK